MNPTDPISFRPCQELSNERLKQILAFLPQPLAIYNRQGQLEYVNPAGQQLPIPQQISPAARDHIMREARLVDLQGQQMMFQVHSRQLRNESGELDGALECYVDITQQRQEAQRLQVLQGHLLELAHRDSLTNLANRRYLELTLEKLAAETDKRVAALLYADLDGFKPINDNHGHLLGDAVLSTIAERLRQTLRGSDLLARVGGDEFAILLDGVSESGAKAVAGKIIQAVSQPLNDYSEPNRLSISIGICLFRVGPGMSKELFLQADLAMYRAKRRGGQQFEIVNLPA